ncbi:MAG: hypothetical protein ABR555_18510 [Pyrinomonadaceae bacterium]
MPEAAETKLTLSSVPGNPKDPNTTLELLEHRFTQLIAELTAIVAPVPKECLYAASRLHSLTIGECVLKSAAVIEQTFGGVTANLWDDPYEWTLPETLSTPEKVVAYLREVDKTRERAFAFFDNDSVLLKKISTPSGDTSALLDVLLDTLVRAARYQGQAIAIRDSSSDAATGGLLSHPH